MINHIKENRAFKDYFNKKTNSADVAEKKMIGEFIKYRQNWNDLPKYLIKNQYTNKRMEEESIPSIVFRYRDSIYM